MGTLTFEFTVRNTKSGQVSAPASITMTTVAPTADRFPGDPGIGKILFGNNAESPDTNIATFNTKLVTKASCARRYNGTNCVFGSGFKSDILTDKAAGRVTLQSTKYGGRTGGQMVGGAADADWEANAVWLWDTYLDGGTGTAKMSFSPVGHEPEDNFTTASEMRDYRKAFRRAVRIMELKRPGIWSKIAVAAPWLMEFTYDTATKDYRNWHPNIADDGVTWLHDGPFNVKCMDGSVYVGSWIHLDAIDLYNPKLGNQLTSSSRNQSWLNSIDAFLSERVSKGQPPFPFSIGEHGLYAYLDTLDDNGVTLTNILNDMSTVGTASHGIVHSAFWTNSFAALDATGDPSGAKTQMLKTWAQRPEVVKAP